MADKLNMSLDDIIRQTKKSTAPRGSGGARRFQKTGGVKKMGRGAEMQKAQKMKKALGISTRRITKAPAANVATVRLVNSLVEQALERQQLQLLPTIRRVPRIAARAPIVQVVREPRLPISYDEEALFDDTIEEEPEPVPLTVRRVVSQQVRLPTRRMAVQSSVQQRTSRISALKAQVTKYIRPSTVNSRPLPRRQEPKRFEPATNFISGVVVRRGRGFSQKYSDD